MFPIISSKHARCIRPREIWTTSKGGREAKKLHVPGLSSKIKREIDNEQNPEPKNNIIKGPNRAIPSSGNAADEDIDFLYSHEIAYQTALKKTRQGYERGFMISHIREMLPNLSEQVVKDIVDEAVETIVAEDILNWRDQKASLEEMTYPEQSSISEHISSSAESEWPTEMVRRMAVLRAAEGMDSMSLAKLLQRMFPHINESQIQKIAVEATKEIKASPNYDSSGEHPPDQDQPPPKNRKRETDIDDDFDDLETLPSKQLAIREELVAFLQPRFSSVNTETIRRIAHVAVLRIAEETASAEEATGQFSQPDTNEDNKDDDGNFQVLNKRASERRHFPTDRGRVNSWRFVYNLCEGSLDKAVIEEKLNSIYGYFGGPDDRRILSVAEGMKVGIEADIAVFNVVAPYIRSNREGFSMTFQDLSLTDQKRTGLLLVSALTQARGTPIGLPELVASLRAQSRGIGQKNVELVARAAFFILGNPDYAQEL